MQGIKYSWYLVKSLPPVNFKGETIAVKKVKTFEGFKVPPGFLTATKDQVEKVLETNLCGPVQASCKGLVKCDDCLFQYSKITSASGKSACQRFLNYRWGKDKDPEKRIAVHCKTKEEWTKVQKKALKNNKRWLSHSASFARDYDKEYPCLTLELDNSLMRSSEEYLRRIGWEIITAREYLDKIEGYTSEVVSFEETGEIDIEVFNYSKRDWDVDVSFSLSGRFIHPKITFNPKPESEDKMSTTKVRTYMVVVYGGDVGSAVLVDKHFGRELDDTFDEFTRNLWLTDKKDEYLKEAQKLEAENQAMKDAAKG